MASRRPNILGSLAPSQQAHPMTEQRASELGAQAGKGIWAACMYTSEALRIVVEPLVHLIDRATVAKMQHEADHLTRQAAAKARR